VREFYSREIFTPAKFLLPRKFYSAHSVPLGQYKKMVPVKLRAEFLVDQLAPGGIKFDFVLVGPHKKKARRRT